MARLAGRNVHWRAFVAGRLEGSDGVTDPCVSGEDACPIHGCQITGQLLGVQVWFDQFKVPLRIWQQCASGYKCVAAIGVNGTVQG